MAEKEAKQEAEGKKKGSKLPIIGAMIVMLAAGGFFGMKMKGGAKSGPPPITLAKGKPVDLKQFLVNLRDQGVYLETNISLGLSSTADPAAIADDDSAIRDVINMRLMSKTLAQVSTPAGLKTLKEQLASDINNVIEGDKNKDKDSDSKDQKDSTKPAKNDAGNHPDWDSQTGPVLKVYFDSFLTQ